MPDRRQTGVMLPEDPGEEELARDWTLSEADHGEVLRCHGDDNRRRFAIQLCDFAPIRDFSGPLRDGSSTSDRLAKALTALGHAVKTIFVLRYLSDPDLRYRVQLQLSHGESRHELVGRCLFFANRGEFRTGDAEEIMNKASCLSLLSNAVLVWNTIRMTQIVDQLRGAGHEIADQELAHVSPLMHTHVIPNGTYRFGDEEEPGRYYAAAS